MRLVARSTKSILDQRREELRRRRAAASALGSAYPAVERIRIEFNFEDATREEPSGQKHVIYPAAPAHFEFSCPFGDCDGGFDLNTVLSKLMKDSKANADGTVQCIGTRTGTDTGMTRQPCGLQAHYRIAAAYAAKPVVKRKRR